MPRLHPAHLAAILFAASPVAAIGGDASGVDPQALAQCISNADSDGARLDCAGTAQPACIAYAKSRYPEMNPVDMQLNCLDAEWQYWETELTRVYTELLATEEARGADRAAALRRMERDWISFRDARCAYDKVTNGRGTGGAVAEPQCKLNETARQVILLMSYQRDRT
ncbi:lysozyme inhibitor LprI family protein [Paracoccus pacificus]|uniref:Lysozyme inhibitor LprI family protein n=1 Tax=Paracoccus pacificus TaxID=1463598 RepID=A0ABW4R4Q1_9RHOB